MNMGAPPLVPAGRTGRPTHRELVPPGVKAAKTRAMAVPVIQPKVGCLRRLWDIGSSTVETPYEWWSAICKQEVLGFDSCLAVRNRKWRLICADKNLRLAYMQLGTRGGVSPRSHLAHGPQAPSSETVTGLEPA